MGKLGENKIEDVVPNSDMQGGQPAQAAAPAAGLPAGPALAEDSQDADASDAESDPFVKYAYFSVALMIFASMVLAGIRLSFY